MTHKADSSFFAIKRQWSERKDLFLRCYLKPYLWKIAKLKRPVLLVDGFAGPGQYRDGKEGSPLILCEAAEQARKDGLDVPVDVLCVEKDAGLFTQLNERISNRSNTRAVNADFQSLLAELESRARTHSVFLYLDPFTVTGLSLDSLDRVLKWVQAGSSVELLLNFSGTALSRIGCSLLKVNDAILEEEEDSQLIGGESAGIDDLSAVLGGDWWKSIAESKVPFPDKVAAVTAGYCGMLRKRFAQVGSHDIRAKSKHALPKYTMVFGSRHPDALMLMNDAAVQSTGTLAEQEVPAESMLFEFRTESLVPSLRKLSALVLAELIDRTNRKELAVRIVRKNFGIYSQSQIYKAVTNLITEGQIASSTNKSRINDSVTIWRISASKKP